MYYYYYYYYYYAYYGINALHVGLRVLCLVTLA